MAEIEKHLALSCDDSYLSVLTVSESELEDSETLVSDAKYAEELQFQEVIMRSIIFSTTNVPVDSLSSSENNDSKENIAESSQCFCEICAEKKDNNQMFSVRKCSHHYCTDCIAKHIEIKVQKSAVWNRESAPVFTCPGLDCEVVIEIDMCREIMPRNVVGIWDDMICESIIASSEKFYCPYKDCSRLMVNDGSMVIRESECPFCNRLFCAQCKIPWHSGLVCEDILKLDEEKRRKEDLMVHELARKEKWQRCPHCKYFVEKTEGCLHMTCRCGHQFCYACGAIWSSSHGGCQ